MKSENLLMAYELAMAIQVYMPDDKERIEELRKLKGEVVDYRWGVDFDRAVDDLEAEIAERFMELPVDAYGVSIRPDDLMACTAFDTNDFDGKEHVLAVGNGFWVDKYGCTHIPSETRHVKPRTIEDVLKEFASQQHGITTEENDALIVKYADELRSMGVGE